jgi:acyl phosphate:glycerol-3-phosphate acyltransferase
MPDILYIFIGIIGILTAILAYFIGAIPTGYLIAKCKGINDIRNHGSGNIGATNVSRVLGKHYFFLIFFLDAGKAYLFIQLIKPYFDFSHLCIFASILLFGNGYSIFLRGSGGKGVATLCGLLVALNAKTALIVFGIWSLLLLMLQTVGIASVGAAIGLPFCAYATHNQSFFLFSFFATLWIIQRHQSNIAAYWHHRAL